MNTNLVSPQHLFLNSRLECCTIVQSTYLPSPNDIPLACRGFVGFYRAYFSPCFAIVGLIGNSFVILLNVYDTKKSRFTVYCMSLAISHTLILLFNSLLDDFLGRGLCYALHSRPLIKLDTLTDYTCKFMEFIPNSMYAWSSWTLFLFSIDRLLTVYSPINYFSTKFIQESVIVCILVAFLALFIHIPVLMSYRLIERPSLGVVSDKKCDVTQNDIVAAIFLHVKIIWTFTIPTGCIFLLNVMICVVFWRQLRRRQRLFSFDVYQNHREMNRVIGHLALTWTFLLFNVPLVTVMIMRHYYSSREKVDPSLFNMEDLSRLFSSIKDITYASDFFLYFLFLRSFRRRFLKMTVKPLLRLTCVAESRCGYWIKMKLSLFNKTAVAVRQASYFTDRIHR